MLGGVEGRGVGVIGAKGLGVPAEWTVTGNLELFRGGVIRFLCIQPYKHDTWLKKTYLPELTLPGCSALCSYRETIYSLVGVKEYESRDVYTTRSYLCFPLASRGYLQI